MEHKIKKRLSQEELGRYLHTLADAVQKPGEVHDRELARLTTDFAKLELKCKREADGMSITLKVKADARRALRQQRHRESLSDPSGAYKALKKSMQATFRQIGAMIADNRTPEDLLIQTFQTEALAMIRYPDRGEPHYEAFEAACRHLVEACQSNRMDDMRQAFDALSKMKKDCHSLYK